MFSYIVQTVEIKKIYFAVPGPLVLPAVTVCGRRKLTPDFDPTPIGVRWFLALEYANESNFTFSSYLTNSPVSQYKCPRAVALASSACVDKTTKIVTEFTRKDPFLHLKRAT